MSFRHVKVGDIVTRWFADKPMQMRVTEVDEKLITAGMGWQFERDTGAEYDPELHWGTEFGRTGSHLLTEEDFEEGSQRNQA